MNASLHSTTMEGGRAEFNVFARIDHDDARALADEADLTAVIIFVAIGLLLTAAFFTLGFGTEIVRILAASG
ncbi:MAG: hypothetical protein J2P54_03255 [Bradyrhizobiaceae bacterium]|nr:hypothetical protein [Bradyrhizobiaceae bacterium]